MFIDASALCAILLDEPEGKDFLDRIDAASQRFTSPMAIYETAMALARYRGGGAGDAGGEVQAFLDMADIRVVAITSEVGFLALGCYDRFGKGRHPARLNMGDCFAYACARANDTPLLFQGEDFALTDIEVV